MPDAIEAPQPLDVDVEQLSRFVTLVPNDRRRRFKVSQSAQASRSADACRR
jgi:hypothetical protein